MPANDKEVRLTFPRSTLETIDEAMYKYLKELNLFTTTNKGWTRVAVVWASAERAFQSKRGSDFRDAQGALKLPIVSVERTSTVKDPEKKGAVWANVPPVPDGKGGVMPVARYINHVKTKNFANADSLRHRGQINFPTHNQKVVYQTYSTPIPVYITNTYEVTIRTEYQQQMNELIAPFMTNPGGINYITITSNSSHRYEGFIQQDFAQSNNLSDHSSEERKFETKINIEVLGYLIGADKNQDEPFLAIRENAVEVKMPRERLMLGEIPEHEMGAYYGLAGVLLPTPGQVCPPMPFTSNVPAAGAGTAGSRLTSAEFKNIFIENYAIREAPSGVIGGGNTIFTTKYNIKENTETVFFNGLLIYTFGGDPDYTIIGPNTIKFADDYTPKLAAEKIVGAIDDLILITYVRDN